MKRGLISIGPREAFWTIRVGTEHMVIGQHVREAQALGRLGIIADGGRVGADLGLRKHHTYSHTNSFWRKPYQMDNLLDYFNAQVDNSLTESITNLWNCEIKPRSSAS